MINITSTQFSKELKESQNCLNNKESLESPEHQQGWHDCLEYIKTTYTNKGGLHVEEFPDVIKEIIDCNINSKYSVVAREAPLLRNALVKAEQIINELTETTLIKDSEYLEIFAAIRHALNITKGV